MGLAHFLSRRFVTAIFVLFGVSVITFVLSHSVPGDPIIAWLGRAASLHPELVEYYRQQYHLDAPLFEQYAYYIAGLAQGNLGFSPVAGRNVAEVFERSVPLTLQLLFFSFVFTSVLGITMGAIAAKFANRLPDGIIRILYMGGTASPAFFLALVLVIVFAFLFPVLPTGGTIDPSIAPPPRATGFPMLDSLLAGNWRAFESQLSHIILPSMANSLGIFGIITRVLRSSMLDTLSSNYIRTARAKGVSENAVFFRHALRNSLIPVVTLLGVMVNFFIVSSIFVEYVFSYPGVGNFAVQSVLNSDYPGILSTTLLFALMIVIANLTADIIYGVIDPRIRLTGG
ncbi:MAG: ABC transporter permease [Thaumarchaeota archaeon]|nr:ABC transporter permease [Nitrososphaerota archaeon]MBI3022106.1 ABC transporter permease [Nitrososphaerota archaeon]MCS4540283.1 ABC transporter permease [Nitrososphaerota archaeon]